MSRMIATIGILALAATALGTPYYYGYEANDGRFPEQCGWTRYFDGGGAVRTVQDGYLSIDSRASDQIYDCFQINRSLDPGPGEVFTAEWRVRVRESSPYADPSVYIARDGVGSLNFAYRPSRVISTMEQPLWWHDFASAGLFHTYRVLSADMTTFDFFVDGIRIHQGAWDLYGFNRSFFGWGDACYGGGGTSLSDWDYVRFWVARGSSLNRPGDACEQGSPLDAPPGATPEPSSFGLLVLAIACGCRRRI